MPPYRIVQTFKPVTALPEDVVVNVSHYSDGAVPEPAAAVAKLFSAMNDPKDISPNAIRIYLNAGVITGQVDYAVYDVADPEPRVPIYEETRQLGSMGGGTVPVETAIVGALEAVPISGVPQARRRGRMFFGPIASVALSMTSGRCRVTQPAQTAIAAGLRSLITGGLPTWGVYSRVNGTMATAVQGWVDDAPDTQRRRGRGALKRTTYSPTGVVIPP